MSATDHRPDAELVRQRLHAIANADHDLVSTLKAARKSFKEFHVESMWNNFERRLLTGLNHLGIDRLESEGETAGVSHALAGRIEELRTSLISQVCHERNREPSEVAEDLTVRLLVLTLSISHLIVLCAPLCFDRTKLLMTSDGSCVVPLTGR